MPSNLRKYSSEFKQQMVELSIVRGNVQEVAREMGLNAGTIYRWKKELLSKGLTTPNPKTNSRSIKERHDFTRLKQRLADLEKERDILKKAIHICTSIDWDASGVKSQTFKRALLFWD